MQDCDLPLGLIFTGHYLQVLLVCKIKLQAALWAYTNVFWIGDKTT